MRKQINPTIKAHLVRGAFYLLLLVAVCAIPFALAQRNATSQSVSKLGSASKRLVGVRNVLPATIILVTNINDSGTGSLRQALVDANDGDTINFDSSLKGQTITLTSGQLNVDKDVTISGLGANHLAVDGNAQSRVFYVNLGKTVAIDGLTITNGHVTNGDGGGISNRGIALTVSNCTISGNSGGGISNVEGFSTLTVTNCTLSGNSADYGGGIVNLGYHGGATLTITNSTLGGNSAGVSGGGIYTIGFAGDATLTITNSTLSGNSAGVSGGGISSGAGSGEGAASSIVMVSNSTISGNSAGDGGGIYNVGNFHGTAGLSVSNSTLSGNSATGNGGGIYNYRGSGGFGATLEIGSTILNAGGSGENIFNDSGTVTSHGYNLSSDDGGGYLTGPGDQINTDPLLGPLQDNGGATFTHALLLGSPAIDTGDPNFTPPPFYDQRGPGFPRVVNGRIDRGSFEVQSGGTPTPTPTPTATPTPRATPIPRSRPTPPPRP